MHASPLGESTRLKRLYTRLQRPSSNYFENTLEMLKGFGVLGLIPCESKGSAHHSQPTFMDLAHHDACFPLILYLLRAILLMCLAGIYSDQDSSAPISTPISSLLRRE
jgi:hypothetical protein